MAVIVAGRAAGPTAHAAAGSSAKTSPALSAAAAIRVLDSRALDMFTRHLAGRAEHPWPLPPYLALRTSYSHSGINGQLPPYRPNLHRCPSPVTGGWPRLPSRSRRGGAGGGEARGRRGPKV